MKRLSCSNYGFCVCLFVLSIYYTAVAGLLSFILHARSYMFPFCPLIIRCVYLISQRNCLISTRLLLPRSLLSSCSKGILFRNSCCISLQGQRDTYVQHSGTQTSVVIGLTALFLRHANFSTGAPFSMASAAAART